MWYCLILILLVIFYIWLGRVFYTGLAKKQDTYRGIKNDIALCVSENKKLRTTNTALSNSLEQVIALYDITKQICKFLDAEKVFNSFKEEVNKHIKISDCQFLDSGSDLSAYADYIILPILIDKDNTKYLVASGVAEQNKERFYILAQQFMLGVKRAFLYQKVQELAITDALTGVLSRRYFLERFKEELARSDKFNYNFACLMMDIDHFKDYNDRYGHLVGDAILKEVSKLTKEGIRQIDLIGRYGGEEFSIILTETDKEEARFVAGRILQTIESRYFKVYDEDLKFTVSIGISIYPADAKDIDTLLERADLALYQAKQTGRNRVCIYKE